MDATILTDRQKLFLKLFSKQPFSQKFYLSGGTALAGFYIPYRFSEDLDFFSEQEVVIDEVVAFISSIKSKLGFLSFEYNTSFNRNLVFLLFSDQEQLKLEFTYYPFSQFDAQRKEYGIKIDSIKDIAVNKLFTIYQNPRSRDFIDLYMIIKKYDFIIDDLIKKARIKFDLHIDLLKLGTQFMQVKELKDLPRLLEPIDEQEWQNFFIDQAKKLSPKIIEQ